MSRFVLPLLLAWVVIGVVVETFAIYVTYRTGGMDLESFRQRAKERGWSVIEAALFACMAFAVGFSVGLLVWPKTALELLDLGGHDGNA